jgi:hypothetical protein
MSRRSCGDAVIACPTRASAGVWPTTKRSAHAPVTVVVSWLAPTSSVIRLPRRKKKGSVFAVADQASVPEPHGAVAVIAMASELPGASFASRTLMTSPESVAVAQPGGSATLTPVSPRAR